MIRTKGVVRTVTERKGRVSRMAIVETARRRDEARVAPERKEYQGLCTSCRNAAGCTYPRDSDRAVVQCEEFEGYEPLQRRAPSQTSAAKPEDSGKYKGLCVNCENRQHCTFPKPEGGVLHCEEYE
jgi:hypothetical protein